ncbi:MAG: hypothetical protein ABI609_13730 [Acidobacteriota bacterium]
MTKNIAVEDATNPDPITGEPGAHPVGTGLGSAGGAATGAAIGAVGGPLGAAIGGVIGAVAGGLAGHGVAEMVNPTLEDAYWRENYQRRPYAQGGTYEQYRDAYRYGWEARSRHPARQHFNDVEPELRHGWHAARGSSTLEWEAAQHATRDAWERLEQTEPGTIRP